MKNRKGHITDSTGKNKNNSTKTIKYILWKSFKKHPDQWLLVMLTIAIVALGTVQTCKYVKATNADLRAYLNITIVPDTTHWGAVIIYIKNVGKTPAYNVRYFWRFKVDTAGFPIEEFLKFKEDTVFNRNFIGQNVEIPYCINSRVTFRTSEVDSLENWKGLGLYYFGKILYEDKFGDPHFVRYNVLFHARLNRYIYLGYFNEAD